MNSTSSGSSMTARLARVVSLVILTAMLSAIFALARPQSASADAIGRVTITQVGRSYWEVPAGVNAVTVEVRGAEGGPFLPISDPNTQATNMSAVINEKAFKTINSYIEKGKSEGGRVVVGGGSDGEHGFFIEPTVIADVKPGDTVEQEEIFGPVTTVIPANSLEEAIQIANGVRYGLSAAIYTQNVNRAFKAMNEMYTCIFYVNASTIGAEVHLPFGGTKATGNGHREAGTQVLDIFSEWKSIYVDFSGKLQRAQIDQLESPQ